MTTRTVTCNLGFEHACVPCAVCGVPVVRRKRFRPTATVLCDDVCREYHRRKQQRDWARAARAAARTPPKRKARTKVNA